MPAPLGCHREPGPSSEIGIHLVSYRERPDRTAVVHAPPPHAVGGDVQPIPPEAVAKMLATRSRLGIDVPNTLENRCGL